MSELTSEVMRFALAKAVSSNIPNITVYKEPQSSDVQGEAIYIQQRKVDNISELGETTKRIYHMQLRYEQPIDAKRQMEKAAEMADILYAILRLVPLQDGSYIRGKNINSEIVDGVLLVYADYTLRIGSTVYGNNMENIEIQGGVE